MIQVAIVDDIFHAGAELVFGGSPHLPDDMDFAWPLCASCDGPMQYLGRVPHPIEAEERVLVFQCGNEPGLCDEWDPRAGGNAAIIVNASKAGHTVTPPEEGVTTLAGQWSGHVAAFDLESYEAARSGFDGPKRQILGHLKSEAEWLQADETPSRESCGQRMILAAQLEEGPDHRTAMNFGGGGCGYLFVCPTSDNQAAFLWQS